MTNEIIKTILELLTGVVVLGLFGYLWFRIIKDSFDD